MCVNKIPEVGDLTLALQQKIFNAMNATGLQEGDEVTVTSDIEGVTVYNGEIFDGLSSPDLKKGEDRNAESGVINLE